MYEKLKSKLNGKAKPYLIYSGLFCIIAFIIYFVFIKYGKSLVWNADGYNQHYTILYNFNDLLRNVFKERIANF